MQRAFGVPTNWEEFRAAAEELTDMDSRRLWHQPLRWRKCHQLDYLVPLLATGGTKLLSDDLMSVTANTEGGIAAFKTFFEDIVFTDQSAIAGRLHRPISV